VILENIITMKISNSARFFKWYFASFCKDQDYATVRFKHTNRMVTLVHKERSKNWTITLSATKVENTWIANGIKVTKTAIHEFTYYYVLDFDRFMLHPSIKGSNEIMNDDGTIISVA
jgi:hypothetical protein